MKLQTEAQTEAQTEVQTEPPELFESWSESWSGSTESWSTESWSWSTEEAFTEQDYEALLCDREEVSVGFFVPLVVMLGCYAVIGRRLLMTHSFHRHRPLLVVMTIVLVFIITQLPHNGALTAEIWDSQAASLSCEQRKLLDQTGLVLQALAFTHPALNPLLYALIGRRFRQEVMSLLPRSSTQKKKVFLSKPRPRTLSDSDTSQGLSL